MTEIRINEDSGLPLTPCPSCGQSVVPSASGWRRHLPFCPMTRDDPVRAAAQKVADEHHCLSHDAREDCGIDALRAALAASPADGAGLRAALERFVTTADIDPNLYMRDPLYHALIERVHQAAASPADGAGVREALADAIALAAMLNDESKQRGSIPYYTGIADKTLPRLRDALAASPADGAGVDVERLIATLNRIALDGRDLCGMATRDAARLIAERYAALEGASGGKEQG